MRRWVARAIRSELPPAQTAALVPWLGAFSLVYGGVARLRNLLYDRGLLPVERVPSRVVCVGNLSVGGTGKTPLVIELARMFDRSGRAVAVLSRGYGRRGSTRGGVLVASDRERVLAGPDEAGDEPVLIAKRARGVPVLVGADRAEAGREAIRRFGAQVLVLDDGFQHRRLGRDLDIVTWDGLDDPLKARCLPRGRLREPREGLKRAGIVLVKCPWDGGAPQATVAGLRSLAPGTPLFRFRLSPECLTDGEGEEMPLEWLAGRKVALASAIAEPAPFGALVRSLGARVVSDLTFPDHHRYGPREKEALMRAGSGLGGLVTTEKDLVRLVGFQPGFPVVALRVRAEIEDREGFEREVLARLGDSDAGGTS